MSDRVDVAVIGAGHAGLNAVKEIRRVTDSYLLVNGGSLGTTCARVGCMPSKVAIHLGDIYAMRKHFQRYGIDGADSLRIDGASALEHIRDLRDTFVDLVLANTTDEMEDELVDGHARFIDAHTIEVGDRTIRARAFVIATGASTVVPADWRESFGDAILTVEDLFELESLPKSLAVIGLGPIGLELGQALRRLGVDVVGFESSTNLARLQDPIINQAAVEIVRREFPIWLGAPAQIERAEGGVRVRAADREQVVEKVLVAIGRRPNLAGLGLEGIGCLVDEHGVPLYDSRTLQIGRLPIFIAGDATGGVANLQIAAEQGRIAGYNACHEIHRHYERRTPMAIVFSDPNIASVGVPWSELDQSQVVFGQQRFGPVGRALILGQNRGLLHLYADRRTGVVLGGAMVGPRCEHLAHLLSWGVQQQMTVKEMLRMPFYHPVIEEALQDCLHGLEKKLDSLPPKPGWLERLFPGRGRRPAGAEASA
ncbi:dihydrolipoyl dehydrogenase [Thiocapsa rosea]|uniref:Dihydrolipoamide dehydrogenase n=1 Tax=Thiocapsa rosea TaxID=69360 RepID=A0A495V6A3_9GAMM|nr:dihydrolipoyl dehydrogenase [Thiocapsa rosea]RKT44143.1 dihydrolipoamide dehydrogenase [Thiocapsa rosea]